ncbi:hypothetical protein BD769DRAFT_1663793 [Suillus cothurnatus]|nr:hypothetical protein BD769DRAFT_1663793 [Suillus cothurnatus]
MPDSTKASTSKATKTGGQKCARALLETLKQMKTNGMTEDFCIYYTNLTSDQRKKYDDEATKLVADNAWAKGVCEGLLY